MTRIEADLFSGRPNPWWTLEPPDAETLSQRLRALSTLQDAVEVEGGLGYRGLVVTGLPGFGQTRIGMERVTLERGEGISVYRDAERAVERWVVRTGEGRLDPEIFDLLLRAAEG